MAPPPKGAAAAKTPAAPAINLKQLNAPTQVAIVIFVAALVSVGYYFAAYTPMDEEITKEQATKTRLAGELQQVQRDLRQYNDDVAELERLRVRARELARSLPDNPDMPGFMRSINTLAEAAGLSISLIEPRSEQVQQYYARVPVRLEVRGSYLSLARFFRSVSQLPRVINMENIELTDSAEEQGEVKLRATILATTFRGVREGETATSAEGTR